MQAASSAPRIVRPTGFQWLLDRMLANIVRRAIVLLLADVRMQAVDSDDFARPAPPAEGHARQVRLRLGRA
jgi:hypothetical protein